MMALMVFFGLFVLADIADSLRRIVRRMEKERVN